MRTTRNDLSVSPAAKDAFSTRDHPGRNEKMIRRRIVFFGTVQGVGFRWRARYAAAMYGCTGWCRNEWDGSVTMEIQGDAAAVAKAVSALENGRYIEVERTETYDLEVREDERDFFAE